MLLLLVVGRSTDRARAGTSNANAFRFSLNAERGTRIVRTKVACNFFLDVCRQRKEADNADNIALRREGGVLQARTADAAPARASRCFGLGGEMGKCGSDP